VGGTTGGSTAELPCRFGVRSPEALDAMPDVGPSPECVAVGRSLFDREGLGDCAIPELRDARDLAVFSTVAFHVPAFGSRAGWGLRFSRELNATDDRAHFCASRHGLPVIAGKHLQPFAVDTGAATDRILPATAARVLGEPGTYRRARLAYRDVASAGNRLTLIAAIVPAGVVTTHTLFCLRDEPREDVHLFLCGVFNSFVANYLVRLRVGTHVTTRIVDWLPVPKPPTDSPEFCLLVRHARQLMARPEDAEAHGDLQALCARLYGLTPAQFEHVLGTFPLVPNAARHAALRAFAGR
jgi:hypothetical protein